MTKELLEQYPDLCAEIKEVEEQMRWGIAATVSESRTEYPYTQHASCVRGVPPELSRRREELQRKKAEIEAFVASLPNSSLRRVVTYRAFQGMKWSTVAAKMGSRYSERMVKYLYYQAVKYRPWSWEEEKTEIKTEREGSDGTDQHRREA